uniref:Uncharacterized protein n=1 Tax=Avena sativa TaxID=4498 RepID=A0ACD6A4W2_AVESA
MAPTSPLPDAPAPRASSSRKRNPPKRFADEPLAVATKRPRRKVPSGSGIKSNANVAKRTARAPRRIGQPSEEEPDDECAAEPDQDALADAEAQEIAADDGDHPAHARTRRVAAAKAITTREEGDPEFVGDPVPADEARATWPKRYQRVRAKRNAEDGEEVVKASCHYRAAKVEDDVYILGDDVYVMAGEKEPHFIGRITELFKGTDHGQYFACRWFYRPEDTVISTAKLVDDHTHHPKRVFLSDERNDNPLDCIVSKVKIVQIDPKLDPKVKASLAADTDLYYDMSYTTAYSTFANITDDINGSSGISSDSDSEANASMPTAALLDLYSGCGGMSTGLCLGAALAGLKLETVRNEKADDFLCLLKGWALLCDKYVHGNDADAAPPVEDEDKDGKLEKDEFVVDKLTEICYGGADRKSCIYFKVQWKGCGREEDTWEPIENLRYALSRLVAMNYQSRLGIMVAGCYGLPQFRMRVFLWGALSTMVLPNYPLPTHHVVVRGGAPTAFAQNIVAYDETQTPILKQALVLDDAISDLPEVGNDQTDDVIEYPANPKTEFQRYIRLSRKEMLDYSFRDGTGTEDGKVLDHCPLKLNRDDFERVKRIPFEKGANFRNLEGVIVGPSNVAEFDPEIPRVYLESGKPLVPDYAMKFVKGRSVKPFGRLWMDETVPTVVTRAEPHNQAILHPNQPRVLTVRENARLQGFPDYYRMYGPIKQRYMQVGNAVAVPVARALGFSLGQAYLRKHDGSDDPLFVLPANFFSPAQTEVVARALSVGFPVGEVAEE